MGRPVLLSCLHRNSRALQIARVGNEISFEVELCFLPSRHHVYVITSKHLKFVPYSLFYEGISDPFFNFLSKF